MISWPSQIWFLSPLKFFFYVFIFVLKPGTSPDFFILSLLFLLFLYVFYFNAFVLCYRGLVEVGPSHLTIWLVYIVPVIQLAVRGNLLSRLFCYYHFFLRVPIAYYNNNYSSETE